MSQSEDLEAIDRYIKGQPLNTAAARDLRDEWTIFYNGLGWYSRNYDQESYDHARNLRNQFNLANAVTAAQLQGAQNQIRNGMTTEEMAGGTSRALSDGMYDEPLISAATKVKLIGTGLIVGAGYIAWNVLKAELGGPLKLLLKRSP